MAEYFSSDMDSCQTVSFLFCDETYIDENKERLCMDDTDCTRLGSDFLDEQCAGGLAEASFLLSSQQIYFGRSCYDTDVPQMPELCTAHMNFALYSSDAATAGPPAASCFFAPSTTESEVCVPKFASGEDAAFHRSPRLSGSASYGAVGIGSCRYASKVLPSSAGQGFSVISSSSIETNAEPAYAFGFPPTFSAPCALPLEPTTASELFALATTSSHSQDLMRAIKAEMAVATSSSSSCSRSSSCTSSIRNVICLQEKSVLLLALSAPVPVYNLEQSSTSDAAGLHVSFSSGYTLVLNAYWLRKEGVESLVERRTGCMGCSCGFELRHAAPSASESSTVELHVKITERCSKHPARSTWNQVTPWVITAEWESSFVRSPLMIFPPLRFISHSYACKGSKKGVFVPCSFRLSVGMAFSTLTEIVSYVQTHVLTSASTQKKTQAVAAKKVKREQETEIEQPQKKKKGC